jgi:hypothetical protein
LCPIRHGNDGNPWTTGCEMQTMSEYCEKRQTREQKQADFCFLRHYLLQYFEMGLRTHPVGIGPDLQV